MSALGAGAAGFSGVREVVVEFVVVAFMAASGIFLSSAALTGGAPGASGGCSGMFSYGLSSM